MSSPKDTNPVVAGLPQNLQGFNVFILSPAQLKTLGLVAKMEDGKPTLIQEETGGSTTSIPQAASVLQMISQQGSSRAVLPHTVTASMGESQEVGAPLNLPSSKVSTVVCGKKGTKKRRQVEEFTKETSKHVKVENAGESADALEMNSMAVWRFETRRHLPGFAVHWQQVLADRGYISCPMMSCNYISLSEPDMVNHYVLCDGKASVEVNACPICMHRLGTKDDLKIHIERSHPDDSFSTKVKNRKVLVSKWDIKPKLKLLPKRRSFCKVHKLSWNIAVETHGYVKCLFQNCSYLALTVEEMTKHYGICNGGGTAALYPFICPYCNGSMETEYKLKTHIAKSHNSAQGSGEELKPSVVHEESNPLNFVTVNNDPENESTPSQMTKTHLPKLREIWNVSLESQGYVKCHLQNCSYVALTMDEMSRHYDACSRDGTSTSSYPYLCTYCNGCMETENKLMAHIEKSHKLHASREICTKVYEDFLKPGPSMDDNTVSNKANESRPRQHTSKQRLFKVRKIWKSSLESCGFLKCTFRNCSYLALTMDEMCKHYYICDGAASAALYPHVCPYCNGCMETINKLMIHIDTSHNFSQRREEPRKPPESSKVQEDSSPTTFPLDPLDNVTVNKYPNMESRLMLLPRRRSPSKVHTKWWYTSLERQGYIKCCFKNCPYLAITVEEMNKHFGICNGGGSCASYPHRCPYCSGCVETEEILETHIERSHMSSLPLFELSKVEDGHQHHSSFIITLNSSDNSEMSSEEIEFIGPSDNSEGIQFIARNKIKIEDTEDDVKLIPPLIVPDIVANSSAGSTIVESKNLPFCSVESDSSGTERTLPFSRMCRNYSNANKLSEVALDTSHATEDLSLNSDASPLFGTSEMPSISKGVKSLVLNFSVAPQNEQLNAQGNSTDDATDEVPDVTPQLQSKTELSDAESTIHSSTIDLLFSPDVFRSDIIENPLQNLSSYDNASIFSEDSYLQHVEEEDSEFLEDRVSYFNIDVTCGTMKTYSRKKSKLSGDHSGGLTKHDNPSLLTGNKSMDTQARRQYGRVGILKQKCDGRTKTVNHIVDTGQQYIPVKQEQDDTLEESVDVGQLYSFIDASGDHLNQKCDEEISSHVDRTSQESGCVVDKKPEEIKTLSDMLLQYNRIDSPDSIVKQANAQNNRVGTKQQVSHVDIADTVPKLEGTKTLEECDNMQEHDHVGTSENVLKQSHEEYTDMPNDYIGKRQYSNFDNFSNGSAMQEQRHDEGSNDVTTSQHRSYSGSLEKQAEISSKKYINYGIVISRKDDIMENNRTELFETTDNVKADREVGDVNSNIIPGNLVKQDLPDSVQYSRIGARRQYGRNRTRLNTRTKLNSTLVGNLKSVIDNSDLTETTIRDSKDLKAVGCGLKGFNKTESDLETPNVIASGLEALNKIVSGSECNKMKESDSVIDNALLSALEPSSRVTHDSQSTETIEIDLEHVIRDSSVLELTGTVESYSKAGNSMESVDLELANADSSVLESIGTVTNCSEAAKTMETDDVDSYVSKSAGAIKRKAAKRMKPNLEFRNVDSNYLESASAVTNDSEAAKTMKRDLEPANAVTSDSETTKVIEIDLESDNLDSSIFKYATAIRRYSRDTKTMKPDLELANVDSNTLEPASAVTNDSEPGKAMKRDLEPANAVTSDSETTKIIEMDLESDNLDSNILKYATAIRSYSKDTKTMKPDLELANVDSNALEPASAVTNDSEPGKAMKRDLEPANAVTSDSETTKIIEIDLESDNLDSSIFKYATAIRSYSRGTKTMKPDLELANVDSNALEPASAVTGSSEAAKTIKLDLEPASAVISDSEHVIYTIEIDLEPDNIDSSVLKSTNSLQSYSKATKTMKSDLEPSSKVASDSEPAETIEIYLEPDNVDSSVLKLAGTLKSDSKGTKTMESSLEPVSSIGGDSESTKTVEIDLESDKVDSNVLKSPSAMKSYSITTGTLKPASAVTSDLEFTKTKEIDLELENADSYALEPASAVTSDSKPVKIIKENLELYNSDSNVLEPISTVYSVSKSTKTMESNLEPAIADSVALQPGGTITSDSKDFKGMNHVNSVSRVLKPASTVTSDSEGTNFEPVNSVSSVLEPASTVSDDLKAAKTVASGFEHVTKVLDVVGHANVSFLKLVTETARGSEAVYTVSSGMELAYPRNDAELDQIASDSEPVNAISYNMELDNTNAESDSELVETISNDSKPVNTVLNNVELANTKSDFESADAISYNLELDNTNAKSDSELVKTIASDSEPVNAVLNNVELADTQNYLEPVDAISNDLELDNTNAKSDTEHVETIASDSEPVNAVLNNVELADTQNYLEPVDAISNDLELDNTNAKSDTEHVETIASDSEPVNAVLNNVELADTQNYLEPVDAISNDLELDNTNAKSDTEHVETIASDSEPVNAVLNNVELADTQNYLEPVHAISNDLELDNTNAKSDTEHVETIASDSEPVNAVLNNVELADTQNYLEPVDAISNDLELDNANAKSDSEHVETIASDSEPVNAVPNNVELVDTKSDSEPINAISYNLELDNTNAKSDTEHVETIASDSEPVNAVPNNVELADTKSDSEPINAISYNLELDNTNAKSDTEHVETIASDSEPVNAVPNNVELADTKSDLEPADAISYNLELINTNAKSDSEHVETTANDSELVNAVLNNVELGNTKRDSEFTGTIVSDLETCNAVLSNLELVNGKSDSELVETIAGNSEPLSAISNNLELAHAKSDSELVETTASDSELVSTVSNNFDCVNAKSYSEPVNIISDHFEFGNTGSDSESIGRVASDSELVEITANDSELVEITANDSELVNTRANNSELIETAESVSERINAVSCVLEPIGIKASELESVKSTETEFESVNVISDISEMANVTSDLKSDSILSDDATDTVRNDLQGSGLESVDTVSLGLEFVSKITSDSEAVETRQSNSEDTNLCVLETSNTITKDLEVVRVKSDVGNDSAVSNIVEPADTIRNYLEVATEDLEPDPWNVLDSGSTATSDSEEVMMTGSDLELTISTSRILEPPSIISSEFETNKRTGSDLKSVNISSSIQEDTIRSSFKVNKVAERIKVLSDLETVSGIVNNSEADNNTISDSELINKMESGSEAVNKVVSDSETIYKRANDSGYINKTASDSESISKVGSDSEADNRVVSDLETIRERVSDTEPISKMGSSSEAVNKAVSDSETIYKRVSDSGYINKTASDSESISKVGSDSEADNRVVSDSETIRERVSDIEPISKIESSLEAVKAVSDSECVCKMGSDSEAVGKVVSDSEHISKIRSSSEADNKAVSDLETIKKRVIDSEAINEIESSLKASIKAESYSETVNKRVSDSETVTGNKKIRRSKAMDKRVSDSQPINKIASGSKAGNKVASVSETVNKRVSDLELIGEIASGSEVVNTSHSAAVKASEIKTELVSTSNEEDVPHAGGVRRRGRRAAAVRIETKVKLEEESPCSRPKRRRKQRSFDDMMNIDDALYKVEESRDRKKKRRNRLDDEFSPETSATNLQTENKNNEIGKPLADGIFGASSDVQEVESIDASMPRRSTRGRGRGRPRGRGRSRSVMPNQESGSYACGTSSREVNDVQSGFDYTVQILKRGRGRGRGRGRSIAAIPEEVDASKWDCSSESTLNDTMSSFGEHSENTGRGAGDGTVNSEEVCDMSDAVIGDEPTSLDGVPKRVRSSGRGKRRKRKKGCTYDWAPRKRTSRVCRPKDSGNCSSDGLAQVKCAKCNEEMEKKCFERHNRMKHTGLSWLEGEEPVDVNDEKLLMRILTKIHQNKKWLTCETCNTSKKSVVGFISHLQCCQKSNQERLMLKQSCELCGRTMLPASLKVHIYTVHKNPKKLGDEVPTLEELENQSKLKRAAATKAVSRMQEFIGDELQEFGEKQKSDLYQKIELKVSKLKQAAWKRYLMKNESLPCRHNGCDFKGETVEDITNHFLNCPVGPKKGYLCCKCKFHSEVELEMQNHIMTHPDNFGSETEEEEEEGTQSLFKKSSARPAMYGKNKTSNRVLFLSKESSGPVYGDEPYVPATKWTLNFQFENYMETVFPRMHSSADSWVALSSAEILRYLPDVRESIRLSHLSMRHRVLSDPQKHASDWKRMKLFEADVIDGTAILFAGGPVWAIAWCPIPLQLAICSDVQVKQYLAVSCHSGMESVYVAGQSYSHPGLIQIWDFGHLNNTASCNVPSLALAIAHEYGAVWCMEWCPSGCYETPATEVPEGRLRRLGLLAAACSDGTVRIFSVCFPCELSQKLSDSAPVFRVEAVWTLVLDDTDTCLLGECRWQCTRLSWYKGKGHRIIAGSFTNGMVAVWDLASESPLLTKRNGKSVVMYPYHSFQPHIGVVSALALSPQDEGRYLMTGSFDRTSKYWDLEDTSAPITVFKRGSVTDGIWLTHWLATVTSFDDVYAMGHANGSLNPVRQFGYGVYPLLAQNSVAWSVSTCDWVNAVAQSTLAGELAVIFSHQLLIAVDVEKGMKNKRMIISYNEVADFNDEKSAADNKMNVDDSTCSETRTFVPSDTGKLKQQETGLSDGVDLNGTSTVSSTSVCGEGTKSCLEKSDQQKSTINTTEDVSGVGSSSVYFETRTFDSSDILPFKKQRNIAQSGSNNARNKTSCGAKSRVCAKKRTLASSEEKRPLTSSEEKRTLASSEEKRPLTSSEEKRTLASSEEKRTLTSSEEKSMLTSSEEKRTLTSSEEKRTLASSEKLPLQKFENNFDRVFAQIAGCSRESEAEKRTLTSSEEKRTLASSEKLPLQKFENNFDRVFAQIAGCSRESEAENNDASVQDGAAEWTSVHIQDDSCNVPLSDFESRDDTETLSAFGVDIADRLDMEISYRTSDDQTNDASGCTDPADSSHSLGSSIVHEDLSRRGDDDDTMLCDSDNNADDLSTKKDVTAVFTGPKHETYDEADKKSGLILCDFPIDNLREMPPEARSWMRQSDRMRQVDVNVYPITSINRVSWNPNCRSFLWLAAGYHCGLVRVPCMRAMHTRHVEATLQHGERKVTATMNNKQSL